MPTNVYVTRIREANVYERLRRRQDVGVRRTLAGLLLVAGLTAACTSSSGSTSSTLSIPAAQQAVDHWQSVVNQDQATLSSETGRAAQAIQDACAQDANPSACEATANQKYQHDTSKLKADQLQLQVAQDQLKRDES